MATELPHGDTATMSKKHRWGRNGHERGHKHNHGRIYKRSKKDIKDMAGLQSNAYVRRLLRGECCYKDGVSIAEESPHVGAFDGVGSF